MMQYSDSAVFVSYAWGGDSEAMVDALEARCRALGLELVRDKEAVTYKASIHGFMNQLGKGRYVIVVISDRYLKSRYSMYELLLLSRHTDFYDRTFPIVLEDAQIFQVEGRLRYLTYWECKTTQLEKRMRAIRLQHQQSIREDLDLFANIRSCIDGITKTLADMNALTPEMHRDGGFEALYKAIKARQVADLEEGK